MINICIARQRRRPYVSRILRSTLYNINVKINNNIVYVIYIEREYRIRYTKTLFSFFLYNFKILIILFNLINRKIKRENKV